MLQFISCGFPNFFAYITRWKNIIQRVYVVSAVCMVWNRTKSKAMDCGIHFSFMNRAATTRYPSYMFDYKASVVKLIWPDTWEILDFSCSHLSRCISFILRLIVTQDGTFIYPSNKEMNFKNTLHSTKVKDRSELRIRLHIPFVSHTLCSLFGSCTATYNVTSCKNRFWLLFSHRKPCLWSWERNLDVPILMRYVVERRTNFFRHLFPTIVVAKYPWASDFGALRFTKDSLLWFIMCSVRSLDRFKKAILERFPLFVSIFYQLNRFEYQLIHQATDVLLQFFRKNKKFDQVTEFPRYFPLIS